MKKNRLQITLFYASCIALIVCLLFEGCGKPYDFKRDIDLGVEWQSKTDTFPDKCITISSNEFDLDVLSNKVYLLQLHTQNEILQLYLNNSIVYGSHQSDSYLFNLTNFLQEHNDIKVFLTSCEGQPASVNANLHCLNQIYIQDIQTSLHGEKSLQVEVKVRNVYNTEKQAMLQYELFTLKGKPILKLETPVFLAGNTENNYRQKIMLKEIGENVTDVLVVCSMLSDHIVIDQCEKMVHITVDRTNNNLQAIGQ